MQESTNNRRPQFRQGADAAWRAAVEECSCKGRVCVEWFPCEHNALRFRGGDFPEFVRCRRTTKSFTCRCNDAIGTGYRITQAEPNVFLRVGLVVPEDKPNLERRLSYHLKKLDPSFKWALVYHPEGRGMDHLHALMRSSARLKDVAEVLKREDGMPHAEPFRPPEGLCYAYLFHPMLKVGLSFDQREHAVRDHLARNGGKVMRNSHGFFLDEHGQPTTKRKAAGRSEPSKFVAQRNRRKRRQEPRSDDGGGRR